jgi:hypothetical protein
MSTTNTNVTIYNGTFRKANGESRTMNFIRGKDLPLTLNGKSVVQEVQKSGSTELVYDTDKREFRRFNWETVEGNVTTTETTFNF